VLILVQVCGLSVFNSYFTVTVNSVCCLVVLPLLHTLYRSILTAGHLQAALSKLLTHCMLTSTQPLTLSGMENEQKLSVAD